MLLFAHLFISRFLMRLFQTGKHFLEACAEHIILIMFKRTSADNDRSRKFQNMHRLRVLFSQRGIEKATDFQLNQFSQNIVPPTTQL